jgi:hypothetical protein
VVAASGVQPHLPTLEGTDSHLRFGWGRGSERDLEGFAATLPRMVRFVGSFGSQSVPDAPGMAEAAGPVGRVLVTAATAARLTSPWALEPQPLTAALRPPRPVHRVAPDAMMRRRPPPRGLPEVPALIAKPEQTEHSEAEARDDGDPGGKRKHRTTGNRTPAPERRKKGAGPNGPAPWKRTDS